MPRNSMVFRFLIQFRIRSSVFPAFLERTASMIASVCVEDFVAKPSYMGCRNYDYGDLCEVNQRWD
jgi:hypothetical protein